MRAWSRRVWTGDVWTSGGIDDGNGDDDDDDDDGDGCRLFVSVLTISPSGVTNESFRRRSGTVDSSS